MPVKNGTKAFNSTVTLLQNCGRVLTDVPCPHLFFYACESSKTIFTNAINSICHLFVVESSSRTSSYNLASAGYLLSQQTKIWYSLLQSSINKCNSLCHLFVESSSRSHRAQDAHPPTTLPLSCWVYPYTNAPPMLPYHLTILMHQSVHAGPS